MHCRVGGSKSREIPVDLKKNPTTATTKTSKKEN